MAKFTENELNWIKNFNAEQNDDAAVIECGKLALRIVKRSDCLFECEAGGGNLSSHGEGGTMKEALENALKDFNDKVEAVIRAQRDCFDMIFNLNDLN